MVGLTSSSRTAKSTLSFDAVWELLSLGMVGGWWFGSFRSSDKSNPKIPSCWAHRWKSSNAERLTTASILFIQSLFGLIASTLKTSRNHAC